MSIMMQLHITATSTKLLDKLQNEGLVNLESGRIQLTADASVEISC